LGAAKTRWPDAATVLAQHRSGPVDDPEQIEPTILGVA